MTPPPASNGVTNAPARPTGGRVAGLLRRVDAWLESASDSLNPILVKEARQALKSQQFVLWFLLLLGAAMAITLGGIALLGPAAYYTATGPVMFRWYFTALALPWMVVVPFASYRSLAAEQDDNTRDALTISALSPSQVINGKLASSLVQMGVYLSALAPCLAFTYMLRGIDLGTILLLPAYVGLASFMLATLGLMLAALNPRRQNQVVISIAFVALLLGLYYWVALNADNLIEEGRYWRQDPEHWVQVAATLTLYAATLLLMYLVAVAGTTFASANRSTPLRVGLLVHQSALVGWFGAYTWTPGLSGRGVHDLGMLLMLVYWLAAGMLLGSEQPTLSARARRSLPATPLTRTLFTWFMPGSATGHVFAVANLTALLLLWGATRPMAPWFGFSLDQATRFMVLGYAYVVAYLGLARLAVVGLRKIAALPPLGGFLVHFLCVLCGCAYPFIVAVIDPRVRPWQFSFWGLPCPITTLSSIQNLTGEPGTPSDAEVILTLLVVGGAAACVLMVNLWLATSEVRRTRVATPQRVIEDERMREAARFAEPAGPWDEA